LFFSKEPKMKALGDFLVWLIGLLPVPSAFYLRAIRSAGGDVRFVDGRMEVYDQQSGEVYYSEQTYAKSP
jgi:hypothetical protein